MKLLVLGGTQFVGRAVVVEALGRGWSVGAVNRGETGPLPAGARHIRADRTDRAQLEQALGHGTWDAVVDTWAKEPRVVQLSAELLAGRVGRFGYVSSISVYVDGRPPGGDESWPTVEGDPAAGPTDYAADKRGGELAVLAAFPDAILARAGMILGPDENIGRLPWWLTRIAGGGQVVAPGRPDRTIQYVDVRDLARWLLDGLSGDVTGPVDMVRPTGEVSMSQLLESVRTVTGSSADLVWVPQEVIEKVGARPWTQLPCWVPEGGKFDGFMESDTSRAQSTGLRPRPVEETVADTWAWLQREPMTDFRGHGLPPDLERQILATVKP